MCPFRARKTCMVKYAVRLFPFSKACSLLVPRTRKAALVPARRDGFDGGVCLGFENASFGDEDMDFPHLLEGKKPQVCSVIQTSREPKTLLVAD